MKYYNYSVKKLLTDYFGDSTVFEMRKPHESVHKSENDQKNLLQLKWQYADEEALHLFVGSAFLLDTILCDDYIAYLGQFGEDKIAYLMFMVTEDEPYFHIECEYAKELICKWEAKGYKTSILRECICVAYYGNDHSHGYHFGTHLIPGRGHALHEIKQINGKDILVFSNHSCWEHYYKKMKSVSHSAEKAEYECLFEPDVIVTAGEEKEKITIHNGIDGVKEFFSLNPSVKIVYEEFRDTEIYSQQLAAGEKRIDLYVGRRNLISEIHVSNLSSIERLVVDQFDDKPIRLLERIPAIIDVRAIDPDKMHSFSLQIDYGQDDIRKYYLSCFEGRTVPNVCTVDGYEFSYDVICSACTDKNGNLCFPNGYVIPRHILYYHSYRQVQPSYTETVVYDNTGVVIKSVYKMPLTEFKEHFSVRQYWGHPDECFGPNKAWLDDDGKRISDITLSTIGRHDEYNNGATLVSVEPTYKYGFIKDDGTWLVPPIYDKAEKLYEGCAKVIRTEAGSEKTFLLTKDGIEKPFDFSIDIGQFTNDRCAFSAEEWTGKYPDAGYYWDFDWVKPGKWGYIDSDGNIIVEPKYVYTADFDNGGGEHAVVARYVDGELRWGVIDLNGDEVIPCKYPGMYCRWGEAVAFQLEENGPYGVMDFSGKVIVDPKFNYIEAYNPCHRLITAGEDEDHLGVYSIDSGKMLISSEYDNIDYNERMISCEISWTCKERYFDYSGCELDFSEYDSIYEKDNLLGVWKDGKCGLIDWEKNVIVPPIMKNGFSFDSEFYEKGLIVSEKEKLQGLSALDGQVVIPEIYTDLYLHGKLVIASRRTNTNRCINDSLFTDDGKLVMSGPLKHIYIDPQKQTISAETPTGVIFLKYEYKLIGK